MPVTPPNSRWGPARPPACSLAQEPKEEEKDTIEGKKQKRHKKARHVPSARGAWRCNAQKIVQTRRELCSGLGSCNVQRLTFVALARTTQG